MGKAIRASALILLLACSAQAGWMGNGSPEPPPSQPAVMSNEPPAPQPTGAVDEPTSDGETGDGAAASLTEAALDLLALLPSLL